MALDKTKIVGALTKVQDPLKGKDLITQNRVRDLSVEGNQVNFTLEFPSANVPGKADLTFACINAIQEVYPEAEVHVHFMGGQAPAAAPKPEKKMANVKNIIAVASGKGGVGKSTVAINLALGLKKLGHRVGIIDADLYGPSLPTMLGLQGERPRVVEADGGHKIVPLTAYDMPVISMGFIVEPEQAVVLRGPRLAGIIKQFFNDVVWPELDYIVVDLPPGTGDIQLTLVQTVPVTGAVMVTTPQQVAVVDAVKAMNMFRLPSVDVPILGVVENMSWFTPKELPDNKYYVFGKGGGSRLAELSESTLLGQIPLVQDIREGGDEGKPAVIATTDAMTANALLEMTKQVIKAVDHRNINTSPTKVVDVKI